MKYSDYYEAATKPGYPEGKDRTRTDAEPVADPRQSREHKSVERGAKVTGASGRNVSAA